MKSISSRRPPILPPRLTAAKLFLAGSTIGPVVDSLHNQCLLTYDIAPITISASSAFGVLPSPASSAPPLFCSSWVVPPLLGIAYVVLGYILPRVIELFTTWISASRVVHLVSVDDGQKANTKELQEKAIWAVTSTAMIIKLSDILQTHESINWWGNTILLDSKLNLILMVASDAAQWTLLDRTPVALVTAVIVAFGGPLSELPFVAHGFWHYLSESADYLPLSGDVFQAESIGDTIATNILGENYHDLALSSITGPCYFAVTMDAIALSRYIYMSSDAR